MLDVLGLMALAIAALLFTKAVRAKAVLGPPAADYVRVTSLLGAFVLTLGCIALLI